MNDHLTLLDLPDEILLIIVKKLHPVEAFYSLVDVNQRLNRLALDCQITRDLDLTPITNIESKKNETSSIDVPFLITVCAKILPRIHQHVEKLIVEQDLMQHLLLAGTYPQLRSLSLVNFEQNRLNQYLTDDLVFLGILKQITHLYIDLINSTGTVVIIQPKMLLSLCEKLIVLNFGDIYPFEPYPSPLVVIPRDFTSSTLTHLKLNVVMFSDCLRLLDGRLDSLSTLIINVFDYILPPSNPYTTEKLPKLKYFSLTNFQCQCDYDLLIVPLLRRMINLEQLQLYLIVLRINSTYINGTQFYDDFLSSMTQLTKFTFNIKINVANHNIFIELPSNEDIQHSFLDRNYGQVASYVNTRPWGTHGECRIYSLPYDFEYFFDLDHRFQGGMFHKVRQLRMKDEIRFRYELFQVISRDFPALEYLSISNSQRMKRKRHSSKFTLITFPNLIFLNVACAHVDYALLFLLKRKTCLPRLANLHIGEESLMKITNNFTYDARYFNFDKVENLNGPEKFLLFRGFHRSFPLLK